ncbi:hypothetical protein PHSC3_000862 [Chlamydiales bacterium STE3]|nr:hypothetical protein PHSC3_000862 [Chlamydiales bacterium STE3]
MILRSQNSYRYWQFELLTPFRSIFHASFQKHGDLSIGGLKTTFGLQKIAYLDQVHGDQIVCAKAGGLQGEGDALVTTTSHLTLLIRHADCQAALIYDPNNHIVAAVHCGWKGSTKNIYTKTIAYLKEQYQCRPKDLLVCISPSLGPEASEFIHFKKELPPSFLPYQIKPSYFDFWKISEEELLAAGILAHHIEIAAICTYANPLDYLSYRFDKTSKRLFSLISLV